MPELPEVEIARENVETWLGGRTLRRARVHDARVLRGQSPRALTRALRGASVGEVRRRGKYLLAGLEGRDRVVLIHLGMAGKMIFTAPGEDLPPWARVVLDRDDGARVTFRDSRVFGRFQVYRSEEVSGLPELARMGPEPLAPGFRPSHLRRCFADSSRPVKVLLLEQSRLAGIGNIQAAESLWRAGLHPATPASSLSDEEWHRLWREMRASLRFTLRKQRGPEIPYVEEKDGFNPFLVYGREGEPCPRCSRALARIVQSARSTYFCPRCQPAVRSRSGRSRPRP